MFTETLSPLVSVHRNPCPPATDPVLAKLNDPPIAPEERVDIEPDTIDAVVTFQSKEV